jgi:hypothetical protein
MPAPPVIRTRPSGSSAEQAPARTEDMLLADIQLLLGALAPFKPKPMLRNTIALQVTYLVREFIRSDL